MKQFFGTLAAIAVAALIIGLVIIFINQREDNAATRPGTAPMEHATEEVSQATGRTIHLDSNSVSFATPAPTSPRDYSSEYPLTHPEPHPEATEPDLKWGSGQR